MATQMLTTTDNPFNPFTHFEQWYDYDMLAGHHSCELLSRFALTCDEFTDEENDEIVSEAIEEICNLDPTYIGCTKDSLFLKRLNQPMGTEG